MKTFEEFDKSYLAAAPYKRRVMFAQLVADIRLEAQAASGDPAHDLEALPADTEETTDGGA